MQNLLIFAIISILDTFVSMERVIAKDSSRPTCLKL